MLKKFIMVLAFIGMASLATGCVVEVEEVDCVVDSQCPLNSFCELDGICTEGCIDDNNCEADAFCDAGLGLCVIEVIE